MIQKPKGTYDVYGQYGKNLLYVRDLIQFVMEKYNYQYVRTPLFESSELFHRGVGETTDIVSKETYDFVDRGDRNMTLRPEGTAGVVRSFIENKMYGEASQPIKCWYYGPMYRYERPQSGRFREFYQFGVEVFGTSDPLADAEVISIPVNLYKLLGLKGIKVKINTLGDNESRLNYRKALLDYFKPHINSLCDDCQKRYSTNPLRILDCKVDHNLDIMKKAPKISDYLNVDSKIHFEMVQKYLSAMEIDYEVDESLVRGLDYYTHTVFEVEAQVEGFGSQNVLCGGGRYDKLVETIGGPSTCGVGFATGIERLITALEYENKLPNNDNSLDIYIIPMTDTCKSLGIKITNVLRMNGFNCDIDTMNRNIKSNFKQADRLNTKYVIIIGDDELNNNIFTVKDNKTKEEYKIEYNNLVDFFDDKIEEDV